MELAISLIKKQILDHFRIFNVISKSRDQVWSFYNNVPYQHYFHKIYQMSKFILKVKLKELNPGILKHIAFRGFFEDDVISIPRDQNLENKFF